MKVRKSAKTGEKAKEKPNEANEEGGEGDGLVVKEAKAPKGMKMSLWWWYSPYPLYDWEMRSPCCACPCTACCVDCLQPPGEWCAALGCLDPCFTPLCSALGSPCLLIYPTKCPCPKVKCPNLYELCCCCVIKIECPKCDCCNCCRFKTVGCECGLCHCTFAMWPECLECGAVDEAVSPVERVISRRGEHLGHSMTGESSTSASSNRRSSEQGVAIELTASPQAEGAPAATQRRRSSMERYTRNQAPLPPTEKPSYTRRYSAVVRAQNAIKAARTAQTAVLAANRFKNLRRPSSATMERETPSAPAADTAV